MEEKKLSIYGVGPYYGGSIIILTVIGFILSKRSFMAVGGIKAWPLQTLFVILGVILCVEGIVLYLKSVLGKNKIDTYLEQGELCISGVYGIVRNPIYSGLMFVCSGVLFFAQNLFLLVLPIFFWLKMSILLVFTEEKWLKERFGESYLTYRKQVNRCIPWFPKKTVKRRIANMAAILVGGCLFLYIMAGFIYGLYFQIRFDTEEFWMLQTEYFDDLQRERYDFTSNQGQRLAGYLYRNSEEGQRGVVVIAHGYAAGGHAGYMPYINELAQGGYYVFAYDATGTDNSEGDSIIGLPQQVIDMDYAIQFVEALPETKNLPVMLWGHSWGGYTVTNELKLHPEVKACVVNAGFNLSSDLIKSWGLNIVGKPTYVLMPFIKIYERQLFGEVSGYTALDAFANCDTAVLAYQCENDTVVPRQYGFDMWQEVYGDSDRFSFRLITNHEEEDCHSQMFNSLEYIAWGTSFDEESGYNAWFESLDYDYRKESERFVREKEEFLSGVLDRKFWANRADHEMFQEILAFYDANL